MDQHNVIQLLSLGSSLLVFAVTQNQIRRVPRAGQPVSPGLRLAQLLAVAAILVVMAGIALDVRYRL